VGFSFTEEGVNFVKVESIDCTGGFIPSKFAKIDLECHKALLRSQLKDGDLLFSIAGALGRTALVTSHILPANTNQALSIIRLNKSVAVDRHFLFYALSPSLISEQIDQFRGGVAQQNLSLAQVRELTIPLPQLEEQKRIVAVLDEAFEGLSRARANAEANLADARELFAVELKRSFTTAAAMSKGGVVQLGSAFETATGSTPPKSDVRNYGSFLPFVKPPELTDGEVFEAPDNLSADGATLARVFPAGSVLVSCIGNLGKVGLATRKLTCNQQINVIKPNTAKAFPEFMFFQALSPQFREQLTAASSGTTVPIVNKSKFNAIEIALPPLDAQREIAEKLTSIQSDSRTVARLYQAKVEAIECLHQSLLQKAFSGELT
jgi:type I restriction enzyme S subunit